MYWIFFQVVLDLGHVTFSNVSDWSTDEVDLGEEPVGLEIGEDDDGEEGDSLVAHTSGLFQLLVT